ncbi:MAG: helix-turn-helix domain-containing protein [Clostridia bacterium]|nr:helix-turn-helix domain-containing protein [Clostridia bacterium]
MGVNFNEIEYRPGQEIRKAREQVLDLSIKELAELIGKSSTYVTRIELGYGARKAGETIEYKLNDIGDMLRLCNALRIPYEKMLFWISEDLKIPYQYPIAETKASLKVFFDTLERANLETSDLEILHEMVKAYISCKSDNQSQTD